MKRSVTLLIMAAALAGGCSVSFWSWTSSSGSHELSLPPKAAEPTPLSSY